MSDTASSPAADPTGAFWWRQIPQWMRVAIAYGSGLAFLFGVIGGTLAAFSGMVDGWDKVRLQVQNWFVADSLPPKAAAPSRANDPNAAIPNANAVAPVAEPTAPAIKTGVFEGYVYYEVSRDGKPTTDSRLVPLATGPMPDFSAIRVGDKFKILDAVNIRANPNPFNNWDNSGYSTRVGTLGSKQCVQVVNGDRRSYPVQSARSGGWLPVIAIPCPANPP